LVTRLQKDFSDKKIHLVFGMMADKDITRCVQLLKPVVSCWYLSTLPSARAASSKQLHSILKQENITQPIKPFENPVAAYACALNHASESDLVVICGSFLTVGGVLQSLC
jgi:dihydrofolate synthase/folylpolyglutamate synthase